MKLKGKRDIPLIFVLITKMFRPQSTAPTLANFKSRTRPRTVPSIHARVLIERGTRNREFLVKVTGASLSTIDRLLKKQKDRMTQKKDKRVGRPLTLSAGARDSLRRIAMRTPTLSNAQLIRRLVQKGHPKVAERTIGRTLAAMKIIRFWPTRKPFLSKRHKAVRLAWCLANRKRDWSRVVFSDETRLHFIPHRQRVIARKGGNRSHIESVRKPKSLHIWAGISARGATPVCVLPDKLSIDSFVYQGIVNDYLVPFMSVFYPDGSTLQQDNAPAHSSFETHVWMVENGIDVMNWPPMSPDLTCIENAWGIVKRKFAPEKRTTLEEWKGRVEKFWDSLPLDLFEALILSQERRIEACIKARGGHTKY